MSYSSRVIQKLQGKEEIKLSSFNQNENDPLEDDDDIDKEEPVDDCSVNKFALVRHHDHAHCTILIK